MRFLFDLIAWHCSTILSVGSYFSDCTELNHVSAIPTTPTKTTFEGWRTASTWQVKCKIRSLTQLILRLHFSFVSQQIVFLRLSEYFPVIQGFGIAIHIRLHYHFSRFFQNVGQWAPKVASGTIQISFPLTQTSGYATADDAMQRDVHQMFYPFYTTKKMSILGQQ